MGAIRKREKTHSNCIEGYEKEIEELADAVLENIEYSGESDVDPFDVYVHRICMKIYSDPGCAKSRFVKGYQLLLQEISKKDK